MLPWLSTIALAHDPFGELAIDVLIRDEQPVAVWTTSGLVTREGDAWVRRCREGFGSVLAVTLAGDDVLLATTEGLRRLAPGGCGTVDGPDIGSISAFVRWGDELLALPTLSSDHLWRSRDDGTTFEPWLLPEATRLTSGATAADGSLVLMSGGIPALLLHALPDDTWETLEVPDPLAFAGTVYADGPDGDLLWAALHLDSTSSVWSWDGVHWTEQLALPLPVTHATCVDDHCYVTQGQLALLRWTPGDAPALADGGPPACIVRAGRTLWGCAARASAHLLASSDDGVAWTPELDAAAATERPCGDDVCALSLGTTPVVPEDTGATVAPEPTGCGCETGGGGAPWGVMGWLALVRAGGRRPRSAPRRSARAAGAG